MLHDIHAYTPIGGSVDYQLELEHDLIEKKNE